MVSAELDAKTGQIYSYSRYRYDSSGTPEVKSPISQQAAQKLAFDTVTKLVPNASQEWKLTSVDKLGKNNTGLSYQFSFQRYVGDIRVMGDSVNLAIDGNGQIQNFNVNSDAVLSKLPTDVKPAISAEQARSQYLKEIDLKLKYGYYGGYTTMGNEITKPFIKLIYYATHKRQPTAALRCRLTPRAGNGVILRRKSAARIFRQSRMRPVIRQKQPLRSWSNTGYWFRTRTERYIRSARLPLANGISW